MRIWKRVYYPTMITLAGIMMICAAANDSVTFAIIGAAFLITTDLEEIRNAINGINVSQMEETPPKPQLKPSKPIKETEEQRRYKTILDNIDNYDGTGKGQTKI